MPGIHSFVGGCSLPSAFTIYKVAAALAFIVSIRFPFFRMMNLSSICQLLFVASIFCLLSAPIDGQTCGSTNVRANFGTGTNVPQNPCVPTLAYNQSTIWLVWNKPDVYDMVVDYNVYMNGQKLDSASANADKYAAAAPYINGFYASDTANFHTKITYHSFLVTGLTAKTQYTFTVRSVDSGGTESADSAKVVATTAPNYGKIVDVCTFGAVGDRTTNNTLAIQQAINNCSSGSTSAFGCKVVIPAGAASGNIFTSGALFLRSNMTFEVQEGAVLLGDASYMSYPMGTGKSAGSPPALLNAFSSKPTNIRITGSGTIDGNGFKINSSITDEEGKIRPVYAKSTVDTVASLGILAASQMQAAGITATNYGDVRSCLATFGAVTNLYFGDLRLLNPAFHGIQFVSCTNVVVANTRIETYNVNNGDGVEVKSINSLLFNNFIDTGDDCVNMAAGQGASGQSGKPVQFVWLFNNYFREGHGAIVGGSPTAAWISDVLAEDNVAFLTQNGLRLKSTPPTGGGVQRLVFRDTAMLNIGTTNTAQLGGQSFVGDVSGSPFLLTLNYTAGSNTFTVASACAQYKDILVQKVTVDNVQPANGGPMIAVNGYDGSDPALNYPETFHTNITFANVKFKNVMGANIGHLKASTFSNVTITNYGNTSPWSIASSSALTSTNVSPAMPAI